MSDALTLGTAGHIDHGKTALVGALTGVDTDRLPEEQERGISIVLGYASLSLPSGRSLSVVDVPGHERFVRTMISGATGIDLALIAVACDDGVMPQTREHVAILELLGVRTAVVALTKRDLVDDEGADLARADAEDLLEGTALAGAAIVETSVRTGAGLDDLREALDQAAAAVEPRPSGGATRLPIDRAFTLRGIGTVVTGTLWSGTLAAGDRLALSPGGGEVRVRSLQVHDQPVESAQAGRRVAAGLVGVERSAIPSGASLVTPDTLPESYRLDVDLRALPGGPGVKHGGHAHVLIGTASVEARIALLEAGALAAGTAGLAQLRLRERVAAARGDRVIVRSTAPQATIAGGIVLDPAPRRHGGTGSAVARLRLLADGDAPSLVRAALLDARRPLALSQIAPPGLLAASDALAALASLRDSGELIELRGAETAWLSAARYDELRDAVQVQLEQRAAEHPLEPELPAQAVVASGPGGDALLARLAADGVLERDGAHVLRPGGWARGSSSHASETEALLAALAEGGFTPPDLPTLQQASGLPEREFAALCGALERSGQIVRFGGDLAFTAERFAQARELVVARCSAHESIALAELRDDLGASRRIAQGLLERLDADGVTRRVGDRRVLRRR
ncbi:MAG TPA: selenocysteine-specific translation elongation factor [Gaiellales bacterium]|jgi:selenocysteine-specific elongation factor|nr:selenocysteine-specific translation elongation factor [Gaiellales bacterium]